MTAAELESARVATGPAFTDAVTFAFGDPDAQLYGLARIGLSPAGASALAVLFAGREPVTAVARGGIDVGAADWDSVAAGGLRTAIAEPLRRWTVALDGDGNGFDLRFEAISAPAPLGDAVVRAGGMDGYEQLCAVEGTVRVAGRVSQVRCLGQRGHTWGEPDWSRIAAARTVSAWPDEGFALALNAIRLEGAEHGDEPVWAALLDRAGTLEVEDPRLSTTYDGDGHQRRACLLYTSPSPRDRQKSRMPSSA